MIKINFFGDFVSYSPNQIELKEEVIDFIKTADFNVINCEAPCVTKNEHRINKSGPSLSQSDDVPLWLENNGFNIISMANNHMMDYGESSLNDTIKKFEKAKTFGAGTWTEAYSPLIIEKNGTRIALLSLTHLEFGVLKDYWTESNSIGTAWINHPSVDRIINETLQKVDYLFIYAHAGIEDIEQPLPEWRDCYRHFIDLGCDGVIASHPHIIQGWEVYKGKPIFYSLGNFYFPAKNSKDNTWYTSISVTFIIDNENVEFRVTPLIFSYNDINICNKIETVEYCDRINNVLHDDFKYIDYIEDKCNEFLNNYNNLFLAGGLIDLSQLYKIIKPIIKFILGFKAINRTHLINNIRCESHRWAICRALQNKYKIK